MFMRRRPLLRAAAVGGSAYFAGKKMGQRAGQQQQQPEAGQDAGQQQAAQAPGQGAAPPSMLDQLSQLTTLHEQGALTDAEFAAAKAKLLG
jgi:membrane protease subunit (stomatin/prohibitin family)